MTTHIFIGEDAERQSILYATLHSKQITRVSDKLRTAAAVLSLNSTRPISEVFVKLYPGEFWCPDSVIGDITDEVVLKTLQASASKYEMHVCGTGENIQTDVDLGFQFMELPPTPKGKKPLDRVGLAARALAVGCEEDLVKEARLRDALLPLVMMGARPKS